MIQVKITLPVRSLESNTRHRLWLATEIHVLPQRGHLIAFADRQVPVVDVIHSIGMLASGQDIEIMLSAWEYVDDTAMNKDIAKMVQEGWSAGGV